MQKIIPTTAINIFCFITLLLLPTHSVIEAKTDDSKDKYVAAKSGINLRSGPGKSSSVITLIPFESKVTIEKSDGDEIFLDGRYGKWVNVKFGDKTGWVFSGFLCDFKPDAIIKPVADFYRNEYNKNSDTSKDEWFSRNYKERAKFKDNQVSIKNIFDNYIILEIPSLHITDRNVVWKYDLKQKNFFEAYKGDGQDSVNILYLDKDKLPDLVVQKAGGTEWVGINILLGSENGFIKIYEYKCDMHDGYFLTIGSCGDMEFAYHYKTLIFFRFNCNNRKLEKYAESEITQLRGTITSIDSKNKSIIIKDEKSFKDVSYKLHKFYSSDEYLKKLNKLQKEKDIIPFESVTIGGTKMFFGVGWKEY